MQFCKYLYVKSKMYLLFKYFFYYLCIRKILADHVIDINPNKR